MKLCNANFLQSYDKNAIFCTRKAKNVAVKRKEKARLSLNGYVVAQKSVGNIERRRL